VKIIDAGNRMIVKRDDDVAFADAGISCRTSSFKRNDEYPSCDWKVIEPDDPTRKGNVLTCQTDVTPTDFSIADQPARYELSVSIEVAKQIPCAGRIIAVLTPTTSPRALTSGPPEFPGLSAASV